VYRISNRLPQVAVQNECGADEGGHAGESSSEKGSNGKGKRSGIIVITSRPASKGFR